MTNYFEKTLENLREYVYSDSFNTVGAISDDVRKGFLVEGISNLRSFFIKFIIDEESHVLIIDTYPNTYISREDRPQVIKAITEENNRIKCGCIKLFSNGTLHITTYQDLNDGAASIKTIAHMQRLNELIFFGIEPKIENAQVFGYPFSAHNPFPKAEIPDESDDNGCDGDGLSDGDIDCGGTANEGKIDAVSALLRFLEEKKNDSGSSDDISKEADGKKSEQAELPPLPERGCKPQQPDLPHED